MCIVTLYASELACLPEYWQYVLEAVAAAVAAADESGLHFLRAPSPGFNVL